MISALLTAIYMLNVVIRAFFPKAGFHYEAIKNVTDPSWKMCLPLLVCAGSVLFFGLCSDSLIAFLMDVSVGIY